MEAAAVMMSVPFIISYGVLLPIMGIVNDEKWREALATFAMLLGSVPAARAGKLPNRAVAELYDLTITFVSVFVVAAFVSYGFIVAAYGNWWLISLAGYSMLPLTIFLSFGNTVNVVPWYYASALVLLSALEPLDNIFLQTIATVLACILGNNLWLPILLITKAPGMANPAWLEVLGLLQQHMKLVKGMGETTLCKLHDASHAAAEVTGMQVPPFEGKVSDGSGKAIEGSGKVIDGSGKGSHVQAQSLVAKVSEGKVSEGSGKGSQVQIITWSDVSVTYLPSMLEISASAIKVRRLAATATKERYAGHWLQDWIIPRYWLCEWALPHQTKSNMRREGLVRICFPSTRVIRVVNACNRVAMAAWRLHLAEPHVDFAAEMDAYGGLDADWDGTKSSLQLHSEADLLLVYAHVPSQLVKNLSQSFQDAMDMLMASLPHDTVLPKPPPPGPQVVNPVAAAVHAIQQHVKNKLAGPTVEHVQQDVHEQQRQQQINEKRCVSLDVAASPPVGGTGIHGAAHVQWDEGTSTSSSSLSAHAPTLGTCGPVLGGSPPQQTMLDDLYAWGALGMGADGVLLGADGGGVSLTARKDSGPRFAKTEALLHEAAGKIEDVQDLYATVGEVVGQVVGQVVGFDGQYVSQSHCHTQAQLHSVMLYMDGLVAALEDLRQAIIALLTLWPG